MRYDVQTVIEETARRLDFLERHCPHDVFVNDDTGTNRTRCTRCGAAHDQIKR
jgi:hypothetical protein